MNRRASFIVVGIALATIAWLTTARFSLKAADEKPAGPEILSVHAARERAKLMHNVYAATLDVMHHRYFREDTDPIPARSMEDVFARVARKTNISARWISVNATPMNVKHKPKDDFEKQAARAIRQRKNEFEQIKEGTYRRAEAITFEVSCLACHDASGVDPNRRRYAALVISMPVKQDK